MSYNITGESQEKDKLKIALLDMISDYWNKNKKILLLSQIGQVLNRSGFDVKDILKGDSLLRFINSELTDSISVIPSPKHELVFGVVPTSAVPLVLGVEEPKSEYFPTKINSNTKNSREINFNRRIWKAFSAPLEEGLMRVVRLHPEIIFTDIDEMDIPSGSFKIDQNLIVSKGAKPQGERNKEIYDNIIHWVKLNDLRIKDITAEKTLSPLIAEDKTSLLNKLVEALDNSEQKRVSLPLDIINKLNKVFID